MAANIQQAWAVQFQLRIRGSRRRIGVAIYPFAVTNNIRMAVANAKKTFSLSIRAGSTRACSAKKALNRWAGEVVYLGESVDDTLGIFSPYW
jgi:hypothetical protein